MSRRPTIPEFATLIAEKINASARVFGYDNLCFLIVAIEPGDTDAVIASNMEKEGVRALLENAMEAVPPIESTGDDASPLNGVH